MAINPGSRARIVRRKLAVRFSFPGETALKVSSAGADGIAPVASMVTVCAAPGASTNADGEKETPPSEGDATETDCANPFIGSARTTTLVLLPDRTETAGGVTVSA